MLTLIELELPVTFVWTLEKDLFTPPLASMPPQKTWSQGQAFKRTQEKGCRKSCGGKNCYNQRLKQRHSSEANQEDCHHAWQRARTLLKMTMRMNTCLKIQSRRRQKSRHQDLELMMSNEGRGCQGRQAKKNLNSKATKERLETMTETKEVFRFILEQEYM